MDYYDDGGQSRRDINQPNRMAIASMICGLCGFLMLCGCVAFPLSITLGVAAIVLAIMSKKGGPFSGYAIAGLILGILALLAGVVEFLYLMLINVLLRDPEWAPFFDEVMRQYEALMPTA